MTVTWTTYRSSIGDRSGLFAALRERFAPRRALYPGSYVDLSPATAIPTVVLVDTDRRAARYFADADGVEAELGHARLPGAGADIRFLHADYTAPLPLGDGEFDLLISLYAGPVWESCSRYLAHGGLLLANTSHGDASLAAIDPSLDLVAAVQSRGDIYTLDTDGLDGYLVPTHPEKEDAVAIRASGRGIAYTRAAFAYVFRRSG